MQTKYWALITNHQPIQKLCYRYTSSKLTACNSRKKTPTHQWATQLQIKCTSKSKKLFSHSNIPSTRLKNLPCTNHHLKEANTIWRIRKIQGSKQGRKIKRVGKRTKKNLQTRKAWIEVQDKQAKTWGKVQKDTLELYICCRTPFNYSFGPKKTHLTGVAKTPLRVAEDQSIVTRNSNNIPCPLHIIVWLPKKTPIVLF